MTHNDKASKRQRYIGQCQFIYFQCLSDGQEIHVRISTIFSVYKQAIWKAKLLEGFIARL